ncbi:sugar ABC transporter substrate-binding protein [Sphaerochaeta sp. S2]|uniref:ABC transporter substrate-binding protein n=1 Tax=Sphaerochaeta sp. S2 TaxID=2798868 RepID=UPI0018E93F6F|nr:sugar ABC transporter substrate-binding protein [Sphaerochaeta sp. S2]MBJ2356097.1 sugar ABC transporter substrate-binding protein [Sphaerochaeta sp. S2]
MKTTRNVLSLALVLVLVLLPAFSAGTKEAAQGTVTLKLEQFSGSEATLSGEALKGMIAEFEKQNPTIKVELQTIGYDDYFTQLQSKVVGGNAADVFELNYENFVAYASEGALADVTKLLGDTSGFNKTALDAFNYQGVQYGVPNSFSNVVLFYNKALFDQANLAYPTADWTWKDVEVASKKIMALGENIWGFYRPLSFHEFYKGAAQNGGSLMNAERTAFTVNLPQNVEAAKLMAGWQNDSKIMPTDTDMAGMGDWDLFKSGRLGMLVTGIWAFGDFTANCPFDWDIAIEPGNVQKATHFFSNSYVVSETSKHPAEAAKLAVFLAGSKEATKLRVEASWELPPVTYPEIIDSYLSITPPENREAVFASLDYLVTPPVSIQQAEMQAIIQSYLGQIVSGKQSAKAALDACQKELEAKISL